MRKMYKRRTGCDRHSSCLIVSQFPKWKAAFRTFDWSIIQKESLLQVLNDGLALVG